MKETGLFYASFAALLFLLLLMNRHAYADQMLSFAARDTEELYVLRAENVTGQIDSVGARLDLADQAQVSHVELSDLFVGGFLSWIQKEDKLFIVAAPPEDQIPIQDTDVANIYITLPDGANITDVMIEESNQVGWQGDLILISNKSSITPTVTATLTATATPAITVTPTLTPTSIKKKSRLYLPLVIQ